MLGDAGKKTDLLGAKIRELIALAVAVTVQCDGCIVVHTETALKPGATEEEILKSLSVAVTVKAKRNKMKMADELPPENEARKRPGVEREYRNRQAEIVVYWEPKLCNHTGNCFRGLPEVFKPQNRPWVLVDGASADKIAEVVMTCPTGALHFERLDGGPQEPQPEETMIDARPNGPLHVRGRVRIVGPGGRVIREDTRVALCRCGASENKPFCDGSHRRIGFRTKNPLEGSA